MARVSTAYITHGGGPLPLLNHSKHSEMIKTLNELTGKIGRPDFIVIVSAHWEEPMFTVTANSTPDIIYDYYGFPEQAYSLKYDAPGFPALAHYLAETLQAENIPLATDDYRGFDHGMFIPLTLMFPHANIPCIQVSLKADLNSAEHIQLGAALKSALLRYNSSVHSSGTRLENNGERILLLGSGSSFHNMHGFFDSSDEAYRKAKAFNDWMKNVVGGDAEGHIVAENQREEQLIQWENAPEARYAHPREEHLIPLHVCYGANKRKADYTASLHVMDKPAAMFLWHD